MRDFDLQPTYYGNGNSYFQPAFVELDAHFAYAFSKNVTLYATLRNVTNVYPDEQQVLQSTGNIPTIAGADREFQNIADERAGRAAMPGPPVTEESTGRISRRDKYTT